MVLLRWCVYYFAIMFIAALCMNVVSAACDIAKIRIVSKKGG